jgi:hypothetical protein
MSKLTPFIRPDFAPVLASFNSMFGGHVPRSTMFVDKYDRKQMPWVGRCNLVMLLYPDCRTSRCGVVDLLEPREWDRPRCGSPDCRCALLDDAKRHDLLSYFRASPLPTFEREGR